MKKLALAALLAFLPSLTSFALTIGTYNIRNFDYDERSRIRTNKQELSLLLQSLKFDVLSVEEVNNTAEFERMIANKLPAHGVELTRCGGQHGQRLGFIYNQKTIELLSFNEDLTIGDPGKGGSCDSGSRPLAIALFKIKATGQKFYAITAHLKAGADAGSLSKREKQFQVIKETVLELRNKTGIKDFSIAGDMNTTEYLSRGADYKNFNRMVSDLGMIDLAANSACSAYWWGGTDDGIETPSLLDHIVVTPGLMKRKVKAEAHGHCKKVNCREVPATELGIIYESVSDHCPMTANIQ
jgi:endonuclease/exonuclease/phosphatase family metal-dependent hydrolase